MFGKAGVYYGIWLGVEFGKGMLGRERSVTNVRYTEEWSAWRRTLGKERSICREVECLGKGTLGKERSVFREMGFNELWKCNN